MHYKIPVRFRAEYTLVEK